jgi:predicted membrane protein
MNERNVSALVVVGAWIARAVAVWMAIIGSAVALGLAWRLFGFIAG